MRGGDAANRFCFSGTLSPHDAFQKHDAFPKKKASHPFADFRI
jgi:hypothetical protein